MKRALTRSVVLFASIAMLGGGLIFAPPAMAAGTPNITLNGVAQTASGTTISLKFGSQAALLSSQDEQITVKSTGTAPATIGVPSLIGTDAFEYRIDNDTCLNAVLAVGATCTIGLRSVVTALGSAPATLSIPDNVPTANKALVALSTTGAYPGQFGAFQTAPGFGQPSQPVGVVGAQDGSIWFSDPPRGAVVRSSTTGAFTVFLLPAGTTTPGPMTNQPGSSLLFFTAMVGGAQRILSIDTAAPTPSPTLLPGSLLPGTLIVGLTANAGSLFATDQGNNKIGLYNLTTNNFTEFAPGAGFAANAGLESLFIPSFDPNNVYFTESNANKVGKMPIAGGAITQFSTGANSSPFGITEGPDGNLWVTLAGKNAVASLDSAFTTLTSHVLPTSAARPTAITHDNGKLWFFEQDMQKMGTATFTAATPPAFSTITDQSINGDGTPLTQNFFDPGAKPALLTPDAAAANQIAVGNNHNVWVSGSAASFFGPTGILLVDEQGGTHHAQVIPTSLNFGNQAAGTAGNSLPVFIGNSGTFPAGGFVNINHVAISGAGAAAFAIKGTNCSLVSAPPTPFTGGNCQTDVAFSPPAGTAPGTTFTATFTAVTSPTGEVTGATLKGTATAQRPFTPFILPTASSSPHGSAALNGTVFTIELNPNQLGGVNTTTGSTIESSPPTASTTLFGGIAAGAGGDSNVVTTARIGPNPGIEVFDPSTGVWRSSALPDASFSPQVIAAGPAAGHYMVASQRADSSAVLWEATIGGASITWAAHPLSGVFFAPTSLTYNAAFGTFDFTTSNAIGTWNPTTNTTQLISLGPLGDFGTPTNVAAYGNGDFFTESFSNEIGRLDRSGASPVLTRFNPLLDGAQPTALTVSGSNVYVVLGSPFGFGALDKLVVFPITATSSANLVDFSLPQRNTGLNAILALPGNTVAITAEAANAIFTTAGG